MSYPDNLKKMILSGNSALAHGAWEAGVEVACAYPGTPSTEILETMAKFGEVDCQWSVNEKIAYEVSLAASIGGARSLYASKHVGVNVAMDALMTSSYTGVGAGFVAVSCDDPGLHSSQNEQDNRNIAKFAKIPLIEPSSPAEARVFVKKAFKISEQFDTPVLFRMTTRVAHTKEDVSLGKRVSVSEEKPLIRPEKYVMVPKNAFLKHKMVEKRLLSLRKFSGKTGLNRIEWGSKSLGFITGGVSYFYAKEAFPDASFLKLGFVYPFPDDLILRFKEKIKEVVVVEELDPFIEEHLYQLGVKIKSKHPDFRVGELRSEDIPVIVDGGRKRETVSRGRRPVMCPGCPHRGAFYVLKKLKLTVAGDIGCYTLAAQKPLESLHTCLCMGAGITFHEGLRRAGSSRTAAVIGDSTFIHSGIPGLVNAVYNKVRGVIIIMDNSTTAMTGGQVHPGTGITLKGKKTRRLSLEKVCLACGADGVDVIEAGNVKELEAVIKLRLKQDGLFVIINRGPCKMIERDRKPGPVYIEDKCKKCGLCLGIDCPAISRTEEGYIRIDPFLCSGCNLCVKICPAGALSEKGK